MRGNGGDADFAPEMTPFAPENMPFAPENGPHSPIPIAVCTNTTNVWSGENYPTERERE